MIRQGRRPFPSLWTRLLIFTVIVLILAAVATVGYLSAAAGQQASWSLWLRFTQRWEA